LLTSSKPPGLKNQHFEKVLIINTWDSAFRIVIDFFKIRIHGQVQRFLLVIFSGKVLDLAIKEFQFYSLTIFMLESSQIIVVYQLLDNQFHIFEQI